MSVRRLLLARECEEEGSREWPWKRPTSHNDPMFADRGEHDSALAYLTIREDHPDKLVGSVTRPL